MPIPVSVIILCRNNPSELEGTLESLLPSGLPGESQVLVIDGSSDELCRRAFLGWMSNIPDEYLGLRVNFFRLPPSGVYAAFNYGIARAQGEWVAFMNSGDSYLPNGLRLLLSEASCAEDAVNAVMGQALIISPDVNIDWITPDPGVRHINTWLRCMVPCHQAVLFKADFARQHPYSVNAGAFADRRIMRLAMQPSRSRIYLAHPVCTHLLDGISNKAPSLRELLGLLASDSLQTADRLGLILKFSLTPLWRYRPYLMKMKSKLLGLVLA